MFTYLCLAGYLEGVLLNGSQETKSLPSEIVGID
jgi:hypothetical protein